MAFPVPVFGDEIFTATDLNRRAGHVLDEAKQRPVTITRNDEAFALLLRKNALHWVEAAQKTANLVNVLTAINLYSQGGKQAPADHLFEWINAFDAEELQEMVRELIVIFNRATMGDASWEELDMVLHEWHESAIASRSDVLKIASQVPAEEVPLTRPQPVSATSTPAQNA